MFWRGSKPVHEGQELRHDAPFDLAFRLLAFRRDAVDLVDEDDGRGVLLRFLEYLPQTLFGFAVVLAHDLGTGDVEELRLRLVGDRPCQPGLAGARRAIEQHTLRRVDAKALEELRMAQRQLDHLAHLIDGAAEAADVVIGHIGPARLPRLLELRAQLDLGLCRQMNDATRLGRDHDEADLLQAVGRDVEKAAHLLRHSRIGGALRIDRGGNHVTRRHRALMEGALQGIAGTLKTQALLSRREHDPRRGANLGSLHLHMIAAADPGIDALQAVEADDVEPLVLRIGRDGDGGGVTLADDLDRLAFLHADLRQRLTADARDAPARIVRPGIRDLKTYALPFLCHGSCPLVRTDDRAMAGKGEEAWNLRLPDATHRGLRRLHQAAKLQGKRKMTRIVAGGPGERSVV